MSGDWLDPQEIILVGLVCGCVIWTMRPATGNMAMSRCPRCGELGSYTRWIRVEQGWFWQEERADNKTLCKAEDDQ